jgi:hypothetical protein
LPCADSGKIKPTRIWPAPAGGAAGAGAADCGGRGGPNGGSELKKSDVAPQPLSATAAAATPSAAHSRRRPRDSIPISSGKNPTMALPEAAAVIPHH